MKSIATRRHGRRQFRMAAGLSGRIETDDFASVNSLAELGLENRRSKKASVFVCLRAGNRRQENPSAPGQGSDRGSLGGAHRAGQGNRRSAGDP